MSLRSMTGFASAALESEAIKGSVTIRSLNHRYLDLTVHLPRKLQGLEPELRSLLQGRVQRGKVEVSVRASRFGTKSFDLDYELRVEGELVAVAKSVQVAYDYNRREPVPVPAKWREKLAAIPA